MLDYHLKPDQLAELRRAHRGTLHVREAYRINAVILLAEGWSATQVATARLLGQASFPTHFHPLVTLPHLLEFASEHGLEPQYVHRYESQRFPEMRVRWPWLSTAIDGVASVLNTLLMHRVDVRHSDYHIILRKT